MNLTPEAWIQHEGETIRFVYDDVTPYNVSVSMPGAEWSTQWVFLALVVIPAWMLGGNLLVLLAVLLQRNLRNLSNRVIASLAFTDFLLALVVVPFSIYQLVSNAP